ncbi:MAG: HAD family hydrolase, partial [Myxococcota bacterium]
MLLLFDIDGTLVDCAGAGRRALTEALRIVCGVDDALEGVRLHGNTDPNILADAFQKHVGRPLDGEREWSEIIDAYIDQLQAELQRSNNYTVLPGAQALPQACRAAGTFM